MHGTLTWMVRNLSRLTWFGLMARCDRTHEVASCPESGRAITDRQCKDLVNFADDLGFENFHTQAPESRSVLRPDFECGAPLHA